MVPKELNDWLQVVGLFGVLGGLIFVGLQLRLDRQAAVTEAVAQATDVRLYWAELMSNSSEVWVKGIAGEPLSPAEAAEFESLASALEISYFRNWFASIQLGDGRNADRAARDLAMDLYANPGLMQHWRRSESNQDEEPGDWVTAVDAEIRRLEGLPPVQ